MRKSLQLGLLVVLEIFLAGRPSALANSVSGGQTLSANLGAAAKVSVVQPSVSLVSSGTFANFTGAVTVQYKVRTTPSGGSTLVVKASSDFSPANGPSIANSDLSYTCSGATLGSCSGSQTVQTTSTNVVTVGGGACSGAGCAGPNPSSVSISLTLANNPTFKTGSYTTSLIFSISAL